MDVILQLYRIWSYTKQNFVTPKPHIWNEFCEVFLFFVSSFFFFPDKFALCFAMKARKKVGDSLAWQLYFGERLTMRITLDERVLDKKNRKIKQHLNWCCNHPNSDGHTHLQAASWKVNGEIEIELGWERKAPGGKHCEKLRSTLWARGLKSKNCTKQKHPNWIAPEE